MQRILRRWRQVVVEEAASEQPGPPTPGLWGELYLREVVVQMAVLSSLLPPLGCPSALTATLPPPFLLPTSSCLEASVSVGMWEHPLFLGVGTARRRQGGLCWG